MDRPGPWKSGAISALSEIVKPGMIQFHGDRISAFGLKVN